MTAARGLFASITVSVIVAAACDSPAKGEDKLSNVRGIFRASLNHDASRLIAIPRQGGVSIWELPAGIPVSGDLDSSAAADGFLMSSDGKLVVVGFKDGHCRVFDVATAKGLSPLLDFQLSAEFRMPALFSPGGKTVLLFGEKAAIAFEIRTGKKIATIPLGEQANDETPGSAVFVAGGSQCLLMDGSGAVSRYDKDWKAVDAPMRHPKAEAAYEFGFDVSDDGKWLVTYDDPGENGPKSNLQVWDATTNKAVGKPLVAVNGMSGHFVGNNRLLVLPGRGEAAVRELPSLKVAYTLRPHDEVDAPSAVISPDRKWILAWGPDRGLDLVDATSGKFVHSHQSAAKISKVLVMPDSSGCYVLFDNSAFFLQGHHDNYLVKLSFPEMEITKMLRVLDYVLSVSLSPDGKQVMVQQGDTDQEQLRFFDAATLKPIE